MKTALALLKTDLRRLVRSKSFYVILILSVVFPIMMFTSMIENVSDAASMIGPLVKSDNPMSSMSGIGLLNIMSGIFMMIFIGKEYQTGNIKHIITVHSDKKEYVISKGIIGMIVNACLIVLYVVAIAVVGAIAGMPLVLPSVGGFILFLIEKFITSMAFTMLFVFVAVICRRAYAFGIIGTFVLGTGAISMVLGLLATTCNMAIFEWINRLTIFGSGSYATLTANGLNFLNIVLVSAVWVIVYGFLGKIVLDKRDVI